MVRRKPTAPRIDLRSTIGFGEPGNKMLDDALIKLVKDVRRDSEEDVGVREVLPEGMTYRLDAYSAAGTSEGSRGLVDGFECVEDLPKVAEWPFSVCCVADLLTSDVALGACAVLAAGDH